MRDNIWQFIGVVTGTVLSTIAIIVTIIFGLLSHPQAAPIRTGISHVLHGTPAPTPTTLLSPTSTPTPLPSPTPIPTALAASGTITKNELLTCNTCSDGDPIHFTINSITIDNSNGRTLWDITLTNVSATAYKAFDQGISLEVFASDHPIDATGYWSDGLFNQIYINAGQKAATQLIFTFPVYKGVQYTFSAKLSTDYNGGIQMNFDDANFTF